MSSSSLARALAVASSAILRVPVVVVAVASCSSISSLGIVPHLAAVGPAIAPLVAHNVMAVVKLVCEEERKLDVGG